jgi:hypothetical protein
MEGVTGAQGYVDAMVEGVGRDDLQAVLYNLGQLGQDSVHLARKRFPVCPRNWLGTFIGYC